VLGIGGLKEKLLAALRGGVRTVLIPQENEKDLAEIPDNVKEGLEIVPVQTVDEVLAYGLAGTLTAIDWNENAAETPPPKLEEGEEGHDSLGRRH
jgi:ATP-dependent Lon protease